MLELSVNLDLFPLAAAVLASLSCGLLGNFLLLRRQSLMGDAISHSVLPGLVVAFLITSQRGALLMFVGAGVAGLGTVVLTELIKRYGRVEPGAAMGVVFSAFFALGVLLIEQNARNVDIDADCVLYGQLELLAWYGEPISWGSLFRLETVPEVPRQVTTLAGVFALAAAFIVLLYKELRLAAFDPALCSAMGFRSGWLHYGFMALVAAATVASFEAVGSILVIAMLVCPAATARLLTDRLSVQLWLSVGVALLCALTGYLGASWVPAQFGMESVNAAGGIGVACGMYVALAAVLSPRHGLVARAIRRSRLRGQIEHEHALAALFRQHERLDHEGAGSSTPSELGITAAKARSLVSQKLAEFDDGGGLRLTGAGLLAAKEIIRSHRLWEHYLVSEAGFAPDHVHPIAEQLEHLRPGPEAETDLDPHGRVIPPE